MDRCVATEVAELAELLLELEAHVVGVRGVRGDDPVGADVAEPLEWDLVQASEDRPDLSIDRGALLLGERGREPLEKLPVELREDEHPPRLVGVQDARDRHVRVVAAEKVVDEELLPELQCRSSE